MKTRKNDFAVLVLAAGEGTRMNSRVPKVLHSLCEAPLLTRVLTTIAKLKPSSVGVVVGSGADLVTREIGNSNGVRFIRQKAQKGSWNAVQSAASWIRRLS